MGANISSQASVFEKVLAAYETGGITYTDVLAQLRRLLATDAPPTELLEILRRRELIEPLPESAHAQVVRLLNDALERAEVPEQIPEVPVQREAVPAQFPANPVPSPLTALESARAAGLATDLAVARSALESEQQRLRDLEQAFAESMASTEAGRLRTEEMLRKLERYQVEFRTLREAVAARDATVLQLQQSLQEREAKLAALTEEHASHNHSQLEAARDALRAEQGRSRELAKSLEESAAIHEGTRSRAEKALRELEHFQIELRTLRTAHTALQQEHAKVLPVLETRGNDGTQLTADLRSARTQLDVTRRDLQASQAAAGSLRSQLQLSETLLNTARRELDSSAAQAKAHLELLQTREWREGSGRSVSHDRSAATSSSAIAVGPESAVPRSLTIGPAFVDAARRVGAALVGLVMRVRRGGLRPSDSRRVLGLVVAIGGVALLVWFLFHLAAAPPRSPIRLVASSPEPGSIIRDCPNCPPVTVLPAGRFKQGTARGESAAAAAEKPMHWVLINRTFGMTTSAVTVDEFKQFVAATHRDMQGCEIYDTDWQRAPQNSWVNPGFEQAGPHPVTCASWNDAQAYAQWLSATAGHPYRLPSASEWEYAARAGGESSQPWGGDGAEACINANVADKSAARRYPGWTTFACDDGFINTSPVGSFKANAFGLNDMLGNVFQWTEDCWNADYNGAPIDGSARRNGNCAEHELRGGSWFSEPAYVRANYRNHFGIDYRTSTVGIRLVREIER